MEIKDHRAELPLLDDALTDRRPLNTLAEQQYLESLRSIKPAQNCWVTAVALSDSGHWGDSQMRRSNSINDGRGREMCRAQVKLIGGPYH